jgi:hypothetical protein
MPTAIIWRTIRRISPVRLGVYLTLPLLTVLLGGVVLPTNNCEPTDPTPILTTSHAGWQKIHCEDCHGYPVAGHTTTETGECATCHGGNGACDPNGKESLFQDHKPWDDCVQCHAQKHSFTLSTYCINCHFSEAGVVDCGSAGK